MSFESKLNNWLQAMPTLNGAPEKDRLSLGRYVKTGEALVKSIGAKADRSPEESTYVRKIYEACRALRRDFLRLHTAWLYSALTKGHSIRKTLDELAFEAAEYCPGLVPTREQIAEEQNRRQADKEGVEIDQGLFFQALLSSPSVGSHLAESALRPTRRALELNAQFREASQIDLGSVLIERRGHAAHLTVNNQYCLNAEDNRLIDDMETAVDLALLDSQIRVGVLRGGVMTHPRYAGRRVFSAGINLKALHAGQISFVDFLLRRELGYISKIMRGLLLESDDVDVHRKPVRRLEKPWIAAVEGFAIGGGAQLLLVFDRVIAAADSYFSLPAAQEGIIPGVANLRLTRFLGSRKARQIILCGRKISAHEPDASLIFDEVVEPTEMDAAVERNIFQLSSPAVIPNRHMINLAEEPLDLFLQYASEFAMLQAERLYGQDVLDKVSRF
jgi:(3,5-dihydroxyphenyl)acetyl-CoA 1,2-dioxygenase